MLCHATTWRGRCCCPSLNNSFQFAHTTRRNDFMILNTVLAIHQTIMNAQSDTFDNGFHRLIHTHNLFLSQLESPFYISEYTSFRLNIMFLYVIRSLICLSLLLYGWFCIWLLFVYHCAVTNTSPGYTHVYVHPAATVRYWLYTMIDQEMKQYYYWGLPFCADICHRTDVDIVKQPEPNISA